MKFKDRISNFFRGCYGIDDLNRFLIILYAFVIITFLFTNFLLLNILQIAIFIILMFRMFSKNLEKRRAENKRFMEITSPIRVWFSNMRNRSKSGYKLFVCPKCYQKLRIPKGKGKVQITCPKCRHKFVKRS